MNEFHNSVPCAPRDSKRKKKAHLKEQQAA